jgi:hypothetical protein
MSNYKIRVDINKLDKAKFIESEYVNKAGETVKQRLLELDAIERKEPKVIKTGDKKDGSKWSLEETHFIKQVATAEEREAKADLPFVGSVTSFRTIEDKSKVFDYPENDILDSPF